MKNSLALIFTLLIASDVLASQGRSVHIDHTSKCGFVVTNSTIPRGSEIRLRAASNGQPVGHISLGLYSDEIKGIRAGGSRGKLIPVEKVSTHEVFKFPVTESGKYGLFLTKDGKTCDNNVTVDDLGEHDRINFSNFSMDIKIYFPEF